ncbi:hypothetical protein COU57_05045 [Candidatus Pacearchaeota archaeon CG10_big_fil_rev_8_21_14_0_10_32_14]|nr:MAG: hypothetical protein COU57_05045 [Candidatus Pacearchaeota archaeon CG10_big_fil_rev_8_21_14_0_10_32_14]
MARATKQYEIIRAIPTFLERDLLKVTHNGMTLEVSYPAFGTNTYANNIAEMEKQYHHLDDIISFRPATISESISIAKYGFGEKGEYDAKRDIFDLGYLQAGKIVITQDGVFTNTEITDKKELKKMLDGVKKVNGIYLINDKVGFAPNETFSLGIGVQYAGDFLRSGLARVLEHTDKNKAKNLKQIIKSYSFGVDVGGFKSVEPVSKVIALYRDTNLWAFAGLTVRGNVPYDHNGGFAFGVKK